MHQYVPCGRANEYPELNRKVTPEEYKEVEDYLFDSGIEDGFVQEEESACGEFIPCFDGTGVYYLNLYIFLPGWRRLHSASLTLRA
jgi:putative pyruvate formate lyase activating enzyme